MDDEGMVKDLIVLRVGRAVVNHIWTGQCHGAPQTRSLDMLPPFPNERRGGSMGSQHRQMQKFNRGRVTSTLRALERHVADNSSVEVLPFAINYLLPRCLPGNRLTSAC